MKILALVPDPRAAWGLGAVLAALPRPSLRVVAFGQPTAAALPPGLDVSVYPVREGTRLPAPFLDALIAHEAPDCVLAPVGAVTAAPAPALLIDLDPLVGAASALPEGENGQVAWVEAVTPDIERRRELLRAGLFSVELNPSIFETAGRVGAHAAAALHARLADMAALGIRPRPAGGTRPGGGAAGPAPPLASGAGPADVRVVRVTSGPEAPPASPAPPVPPPALAPPAPFAPPASSAPPAPFAPPASSAPPASPAPPAAGLLQPLATAAPAAAPSAAWPQPPSPSAAWPQPPPPSAARPVTPAPAPPPQDPLLFRDRCRGGRVLVLAGGGGLDSLTPADLAHATVVAVPEAVPWLDERMGIAQFVCAAERPAGPAAQTLASTRTVLVHADHLAGDELAPRARGRVGVADLARAGGPTLGWSDDLSTGFFPGSGDASLAVQWAAWLGPAEIAVAGLDPRDTRPLWPAFARGAHDLLASRGVLFGVAGHGGPPASPGRAARNPAGPGAPGLTGPAGPAR